MTRRVAVAALVGAFALLLLGFAPAAQAGKVELNRYERMTLSLVNAERAKHNLRPLVVNAQLTVAARGHATQMGELQFFAHTSPSGKTMRQRVVESGFRLEGYRGWRLGEDLAWGNGLLAYPPMIVQRWMASPSHRKVILTRDFRAAGIGAVMTEKGFGGADGPVWFFTLDLGRRYR